MSKATPRGSAPKKRTGTATSAATTPAATAKATPLQASPGEVTVRMYRQGLGDCFLLAFPTVDPKQSYYVLIDCGVLTGTPGGAAMLKQVAADILAATGGQIHLLVVTHRHWDHIAGFSQADDIFSRMTVHNLWLPWLENPDDEVAKGLWKKTSQALTALTTALTKQPAGLTHVSSVLGFVGEDLGAAAAKGGDPLAPVRRLLKTGQPKYCRPGDGPLALPKVPGLADAPSAQIFVLGPPTKPEQLAQMDPTSAGKETYLTGMALLSQLGFALGMSLGAGPGEDEYLSEGLRAPFDSRLGIPTAMAKDEAFFQVNYGFNDAPQAQAPADAAAAKPGAATTASAAGSVPVAAPAAKAEQGPAWRRVSADWLAGAEELALQLDNTVNNTSLVLAIELVNSQKVLLFVGDAQVGNWLSWDGLQWKRSDGSTVTTEDLLRRTILYKVGHHGSHNATVRQEAGGKPWGLAAMTSPDLVAMLPVDQVFARQEPREWMMPWDDMMERLEEQTHHRIMRIDNGVPAQPPDVAPRVWRAFTSRVKPNPIQPYPPAVPDPDHPGKIKRGGAVQLDIPYIEFTVTG